MGRTAHLCEPQESSFPDGKRVQPRESRSPYHLPGPVTEGSQSVVFNAVPLLVLAAAYLETVADLFDAAFAGLSLVSEDNRQASGFLARFNGEDAGWWQEVQFDLEREPSGVASAVFEAAPVAVFDVEASPRVSQRLVKPIGAKSA